MEIRYPVLFEDHGVGRLSLSAFKRTYALWTSVSLLIWPSASLPLSRPRDYAARIVPHAIRI